MHKTAGVPVYVGNFGTYPIPADVYEDAVRMSGDRLNDRRTKGARLLEQWGRARDAQEGNAEKRP